MPQSVARQLPSVGREQPPVVETNGNLHARELAEDIKSAWKECRLAVERGDKESLRKLHLAAKAFDGEVNYREVLADFERLRKYFPTPAAITPSKIEPVLLPVKQRTVEARLFRIIRSYWSMPYSKGYGRRLRFLVFDAYHNAPIGIIGLQSPSADLACRDAYLNLGGDKKLDAINSTLDAFSIGATPTYAPLLAGKLVAGLLHSPVIRQEYWRAYAAKRTTLTNKRVSQPLVAITTSSAFGRSSIYNRLKMGDWTLAKPIGYTKGYGTLHLEELYPRMVEWLKESGKHVPAGFGNGPKVRWQNVMRTLIGLGVSRECLSHGIRREVFLFELAENLRDVMASGETPIPTQFNDNDWVDFWKERWCLPRAKRNPDWHEVDARGLIRASILQSAT